MSPRRTVPTDPQVGPNSAECVDKAQKEPSQSVQFIERFVAKRPGFCLGAALSVGIAVRMVGETIMNRCNGSTQSPPNGVAKGMGELTHDIVSLVELQFELFRVDCREGLRRILIPVALLLFAGIVAVGTVPIVLILIAEILTQAAGLSRAAAFSIAAMSGFVLAVTWELRGGSTCGVVRVFERSREELTRNMTWIKHALKRPAQIESQQPQEH